MRTFPEWVVCERCDSVYRRVALANGQGSRCERCLALTIAAAIMFAIANVSPVVRISLQGLHNEVTLWQSAAALAHDPAAPIAVPAALSIIVVPFLQIALLGWILVFARRKRRAPGFAPAMRMLVALRPWSMVEVCMLGILVAIIKLSSFLEVAPGPGIWAMVVLMVLITIIANRDVHWLWDMVEVAPPHPESQA